eukprot:11880233-Heterocapsa_arctica.AAC.1
MLKVQFKQELKAISTELPPLSLKGIKPKNEQQQSDYQAAVQTRILAEPNLDMHTVMIIISDEATANLYSKPTLTKNPDREDELADIIASRQLALILGDTIEVERLAKHLKKTSRKLKSDNDFYIDRG